MKTYLLPALLIASVVVANASFAQESAVSFSADQRRFLSVAQSLETAPLDPRSRADRAWAMQWLIDAPDVSVTACLDPLGGIAIKDADHSSDLIAQYTLSMAAFIIKHPNLKNDVAAQQIAGVESALKAYQVMRGANASSKSQPLENLLEAQRRGELSSVVRKAYLQCDAQEASTVVPGDAAAWKEIWDQPGVATFYADLNSITGSNGFRSLTTKAQYREPLPEGYISMRIRVEEFDCRRHRSRPRRSVIFGNDGRRPETIEWTAKKAVWTDTEAGSLGGTKESLACKDTSK
jgi:hypothetical protein